MLSAKIVVGNANLNNHFATQHLQGRERTDSGHRILADYLGASHMLSDLSTPDRISEEIVRCISSIYCKLSNTSQSNAGIPTSPISSFSSSSIFSSNNPCDSWSPLCSEDATMNLRFKELKEVNRPPAANIEVLKICIDNDNFNYAATMLQNFRCSIFYWLLHYSAMFYYLNLILWRSRHMLLSIWL